MAVACRAAIGPTSPRHDAGSTTTTPKWAANLLRNWIKLGTATRCSFPCQRVVRSRTDAPTTHPLCGTAPANAVIGITQMDTFDLMTGRIAAKLCAAWSALVTGLSESELPVPSDAQRRPQADSAHTRCSGQEHLQGTALNWQPLLTAKLLIQIGSHYPAPIAFDVHDVIPKLEQPPHPFGGASTQHYPRHRKRRQSV